MTLRAFHRLVALLLAAGLTADPVTVMGCVGAGLVPARNCGRTFHCGRTQGPPLQFPFASQALASEVLNVKGRLKPISKAVGEYRMAAQAEGFPPAAMQFDTEEAREFTTLLRQWRKLPPHSREAKGLRNEMADIVGMEVPWHPKELARFVEYARALVRVVMALELNPRKISRKDFQTLVNGPLFRPTFRRLARLFGNDHKRVLWGLTWHHEPVTLAVARGLLSARAFTWMAAMAGAFWDGWQVSLWWAFLSAVFEAARLHGEYNVKSLLRTLRTAGHVKGWSRVHFMDGGLLGMVALTRRGFLTAAVTAMSAVPAWAQNYDASSRLKAYDRTLEALSEKPAKARWAKIEKPDMAYNIRGLYRTYGAVKRGGVLLAVGFFQHLNLIPQVRPDEAIFIDINPAINEIMLPFLGRLLEGAPTRREFLSMAMGVPLTGNDVRDLLEPVRPGGTPLPADPEVRLQQLKFHAQTVLARVNAKITNEGRTENLKRTGTLDIYLDILDRLPLTHAQKDEPSRWFGLFVDEFLAAPLYVEQGMASWAGTDAKQRRQMAGWLSTEENYRLVRQYWMDNKMIGVTGDIRGPALGKIAARLNGPGADQNKKVTTMFVSCVPSDVVDIEHTPQAARRIYEELEKLPLDPEAVIVGGYGEGHNFSYALPFRIASWSYTYENSQDPSVRRQVIERSRYASQWGPPGGFWRTLLQGVDAVLWDRNRAAAPATLAVYQKLTQQIVEQLQDSPDSFQTKSPEQFTAWVHQTLPGLATGTDIFRAVVIALLEKGFLRLPSAGAGNPGRAALPFAGPAGDTPNRGNLDAHGNILSRRSS